MKLRVTALCVAFLLASVAVAQSGKKDSSSGEGRPSDKGAAANKNARPSQERADKSGPGKSRDGQAKGERSSQERSGDKTNKESTSAPDKDHLKNP
jgi:hypothetical protein